MGERIYLMSQAERLEPLEEERFATENELQELIAEHPELLDGEQIRPGNPRRWILVTREKSVAELPGAGGRWSVDHLIVDQDAVPTLVEVKRGENPRFAGASSGKCSNTRRTRRRPGPPRSCAGPSKSHRGNRAATPGRRLRISWDRTRPQAPSGSGAEGRRRSSRGCSVARGRPVQPARRRD